MLLRLRSIMHCLWGSSRPGLNSGLTVRQSIWCEVLVVGGTRKESTVMVVRGRVQFPQDHSLHRLSCPHRTFSPPLTTQAWLSLVAFRCPPWTYVDVLCANTMLSSRWQVCSLVGNQVPWDIQNLHFFLKSVWILSRFFCVSRHTWEFLVVLV